MFGEGAALGPVEDRMEKIRLGNGPGGGPFAIPVDALAQTFAFIGIRGSGKTCGAGVLAEEFCAAQLPWIALDPTGVWWGLRAERDGSPGGMRSVVVIGGQHGDIALAKTDGARLASALIRANVCAVIDLSGESKTTWRVFLADFCNALMTETPETPRHVFVEEGPEFVPQRPVGNAMKMAHAALDRLIRLGRNKGYGASVISQRAATIDKDVLTQCENVFTFRLTHNLDRKAMKEWVSGKVDDARRFERFLSTMAGLKAGQAFFWSPAWLDTFQEVRFRERVTFHPGATRRVGVALRTVALSDAAEFVERVRKQLDRQAGPGRPAAVSGEGGGDGGRTGPRGEPQFRVSGKIPSDISVSANGGRGGEAPAPDPRETELAELRQSVSRERALRAEAERRLGAVRAALEPQFRAMSALFADLAAPAETGARPEVYAPWLAKAGDGKRRRMLEVMTERAELTRAQLATLAAVSIRSSTFRNNLSWMRVNKLVEVEGETVRLLRV